MVFREKLLSSRLLKYLLSSVSDKPSRFLRNSPPEVRSSVFFGVVGVDLRKFTRVMPAGVFRESRQIHNRGATRYV